MDSSNQQHWELIPKIEPIEADDGLAMDTVDAGELGFLEDPSKLDLDHLEVGAAASGGAAGAGGGSYPIFVGEGGAIYQKSQIIHDCMWAGMCDDQSHSVKSGGVGGGCSGCARQQHARQPRIALTGGRWKPTQSSAQIPAGRSLLIRRHLQQEEQQKQQQQRSAPALRVPQLARGAFIAAKKRQVLASAARPDTPLSLDDDPPEFKQNIELPVACTIGSNQQSLVLHTPVATPPPSASSPGESRHLFNGKGSSSMAAGGLTISPTSAFASNYSSSSNGTTTNSSSSGSNNAGRSGDSQCHSLQYNYNYLQDTTTTTTTTTTAMCTEHVRVNQLRQQLLLLEEDPGEVLLGGPTGSPLHYRTDDPLPDSPDNPLSQLLRDLRDIEERSRETAIRDSLSSLFPATSSSSSTLAAVPAKGNALTVNGGSSSGTSGMMLFRSSLQNGGIDLLDHHHQQPAAACRCEPRGGRLCALHGGGGGDGGSRSSTLSGSRKRPNTWIGGVYDDEADDYADDDDEDDVLNADDDNEIDVLNAGDDDEDDVLKRLELEENNDGLNFACSSSYECHQVTHDADHSYTRPKDRYSMNELGVQTPTDSEEEIDVVSIDDKNLPTNPSARNRRHLESEVASKIRPASSRSPNGGLRHHHLRQTPRHPEEAIVGVVAAGAMSVRDHQQQHLYPTLAGCGGGESSKGMRHGGHSKRSAGERSGAPAGALDTTPVNPADELDTAEKRILHNNGERQRRIVLKNLFGELRRLIPSLRDKDRASKVNILREAAVLCTRLSCEADQIQELRQRQKKLYARVWHLRSYMHRQRQRHTNVHPIATID